MNNEFFLKTAFLLSDQSKCVSHKIGAVIVREGRIVVMGYNGSPPKQTNCNEIFDPSTFNRKEHHKWSVENEIHAEMNAILYASKKGIELEGCDMYVTLSPCNQCLKNIVQSGIRNVYYFYEYDKSTLNPNMLEKVNLEKIYSKDVEEFVIRNDLFPVPWDKTRYLNQE